VLGGSNLTPFMYFWGSDTRTEKKIPTPMTKQHEKQIDFGQKPKFSEKLIEYQIDKMFSLIKYFKHQGILGQFDPLYALYRVQI